MYVITIDSDECGGCGQCAESCPSQIISMIEAKAQVTGDSSECLGCQSCALICDRGAVTIEEF